MWTVERPVWLVMRKKSELYSQDEMKKVNEVGWKWKAVFYGWRVDKDISRFCHLRERHAETDDIQGRWCSGGGKVVSVRMYGGIWVLACIALCGATGAHTSELHFLQAHHAIHRGDGNTCIQTNTHTHSHACIHTWTHTYIETHTHTHTHTLPNCTVLYIHVFPPAISTALQPN